MVRIIFARMIILHGLPLSLFHDLMKVVHLALIISSNTNKHEILKFYDVERLKTMNLFMVVIVGLQLLQTRG